MSFIPPHGGNPQLDLETVRGQQHEIEAKAQRYAQLHPDDDGGDRSAGPVRRGLRRAWATVRRRS